VLNLLWLDLDVTILKSLMLCAIIVALISNYSPRKFLGICHIPLKMIVIGRGQKQHLG